MKKSRFSEEQVIGFLKQAEAGIPIKDLCRKGGFSDATFYKWRARFGRMLVAQAISDGLVLHSAVRTLAADTEQVYRTFCSPHQQFQSLRRQHAPAVPGVQKSRPPLSTLSEWMRHQRERGNF
jgi:putative transposase